MSAEALPERPHCAEHDRYYGWTEVPVCPGCHPPAPAEPEERRSWRAVDLTAVLAGTWSPPEPTVGRRADGRGLFYPGKVHTVSSETEAGKSWLALAACRDELDAGNHVVYIDFEDDEGSIVGRLLTLGTSREAIAERFHYLRPDRPITAEQSVHVDDLFALFADTRPTLGIIDGVTEGMVLHGLNPLDNVDAATFGRLLLHRLTPLGTAMVALDHVTKAAEGRGRYSIGAVHKLNGLNGAAYVLENRKPFGIGLTGRSTVRIAKDRPGQLRRHALPGGAGMFWYGDLVLDSKAEDFAEAEIAVPTERTEQFRPTLVMGRIMTAITERGPLSKNKIRAAVGGKHDTADQALALLVLDDYLTEKTPHAILKPWTEETPS